MPSESWETILFHGELALGQLAAAGATDRPPEELRALANQIHLIRCEEHYRVNNLHEWPKQIRWDDEDYWSVDTNDEEEGPRHAHA